MISEESINSLFTAITDLKIQIQAIQSFDYSAHEEKIENEKKYNEELKSSSKLADLNSEHQILLYELAEKQKELECLRESNQNSQKYLIQVNDEVMQLELEKQLLAQDHSEEMQRLEKLIQDQKLQNIERRNTIQKMALQSLLPRKSLPRTRSIKPKKS